MSTIDDRLFRWLQDLLGEYIDFWRKFFPEVETMSYEEAHEKSGMPYVEKLARKELEAFQAEIASYYGAWTEPSYQFSFLHTLLLYFLAIPEENRRTLLSLGCGPAALELVLLWKGLIKKVKLVDLSPPMLERALSIAQALGIAQNVETVVGLVENYQVTQQYDVVISINAMHWSRHWPIWVDKGMKATREGGLLFIEATTGFVLVPFSYEELLRKVQATGLSIIGHGYLIPFTLRIDLLRDRVCYYVAGFKEAPQVTPEHPPKHLKHNRRSRQKHK
jgi:SAM-dependent methyltransferase